MIILEIESTRINLVLSEIVKNSSIRAYSAVVDTRGAAGATSLVAAAQKAAGG